MNVYYVQPLRHAEGMAMAYLPAEKIVMQANLFDTHEPPPAAPTPAMTTLYRDDADAESRRGDDRAGARQAGADVGVHEGDGLGRQGVSDGGRGRLGRLGPVPIGRATVPLTRSFEGGRTSEDGHPSSRPRPRDRAPSPR